MAVGALFSIGVIAAFVGECHTKGKINDKDQTNLRTGVAHLVAILKSTGYFVIASRFQHFSTLLDRHSEL